MMQPTIDSDGRIVIDRWPFDEPAPWHPLDDTDNEVRALRAYLLDQWANRIYRRIGWYVAACIRTFWSTLPPEDRYMLREFEAKIEQNTSHLDATPDQIMIRRCIPPNMVISPATHLENVIRMDLHEVLTGDYLPTFCAGYSNPVALILAPHFFPIVVPPRPVEIPKTVIEMAEAVYDQQDASGILSDALEDWSSPFALHLVEHYRAHWWHPKGCWATNLLLGKEDFDGFQGFTTDIRCETAGAA